MTIALCACLAVCSRALTNLANPPFIAYLHHRPKVPSHLSDLLSLRLAAGVLTLPLA
jgi:hypothetical protein